MTVFDLLVQTKMVIVLTVKKFLFSSARIGTQSIWKYPLFPQLYIIEQINLQFKIQGFQNSRLKISKINFSKVKLFNLGLLNFKELKMNLKKVYIFKLKIQKLDILKIQAHAFKLS